MTSTYLSYINFQRSYGRPAQPVDVEKVEPDRKLVDEGAYFSVRIQNVSSGRELVQDERLLSYVLTAFDLDHEINNKDFVARVLDEGVFDVFRPFESLSDRPAPGTNPINELAETFWFGEDKPTAFRKDIAVDAVVERFTKTFGISPNAETQTFIDEKTAYFRANARSVFNAKQLVDDPELAGYIVRAFGLESQAGNKELIQRALEAGVYNPGSGALKEGSLANTLPDSRYEMMAKAFGFAETGDLNVKNEKFRQSIVERYNRNTIRNEAEAEAAASAPRARAKTPPLIQRDIDYFRENIGKVSSPEELLEDERLYRFALSAFDLESQIPSRALVKKVLEEGVRDDDALANQLVDQKWKTFARAFAFAEVGDRNVRNGSFVDGVVERYTRVKLESDAGEDNLGVRLAAYFDRKAQNFTSWFSVLADKALREVVFTAFDLPNEMQQTNPDKLVSIFESRMDIEDLSDPEKRAKFIERFTLMYDIRNGGPGGAGSSLLALYNVAPLGAASDSGIISVDPATASAKIFA
jgi:hypothetical protein